MNPLKYRKKTLLRNKDGTPRRRCVPKTEDWPRRAEDYKWPKGWVPFDSRTSSPLRYCMNRYLLPERGFWFSLGMDWNKVFEDEFRFPGVLLKSYLMVAALSPLGSSEAYLRDLTLRCLTASFAAHGKVAGLTKNKMDKATPRYIVFCVEHLLLTSLLDELPQQVHPALVAMSVKGSVRKGGAFVTPFEAAEELVSMASVAASESHWEPMAGIRPGVFDSRVEERRAAILSHLARPSNRQSGLGGRSRIVTDETRQTGRVWTDAYRFKLMALMLDFPQDRVARFSGELKAVEDWLLLNRSKFVRVVLAGKVVAVNAGAVHAWLNNSTAPALITGAVAVEGVSTPSLSSKRETGSPRKLGRPRKPLRVPD